MVDWKPSKVNLVNKYVRKYKCCIISIPGHDSILAILIGMSVDIIIWLSELNTGKRLLGHHSNHNFVFMFTRQVVTVHDVPQLISQIN